MNKVDILVHGYAKKVGNGWKATCNTSLIRTKNLNIVVDPGINKKLLLQNLKRYSLSPSDVDYVFLTHYHPDHIYLVALFEKAKVFDGDIIYINDKEVPYQGTLPNTDIAVIPTPGHAHEHASLVVATGEKGNVVIAADVFWWMDNEVQNTDYKSLISKKDPFTKDLMILTRAKARGIFSYTSFA